MCSVDGSRPWHGWCRAEAWPRPLRRHPLPVRPPPRRGQEVRSPPPPYFLCFAPAAAPLSCGPHMSLSLSPTPGVPQRGWVPTMAWSAQGRGMASRSLVLMLPLPLSPTVATHGGCTRCRFGPGRCQDW
ncbi:hypothetical protein BDA96_05G173400 [Sorghum bicolor]|uniref:Uncharacterized protein n=2 Tax=Sorghum bicolor TaxID=4558 RepID=A0A921UGU4_SORBI|nr:hypothetical protein BDA96_05G173400 [Sorghum bicolor]KXG28728.1 hypothetical protein SORBI_3005G159200 [Sorghum bicolor]